ncbi:DUF5667 domain-containing protein [Glycomyces arizonensis]|uniref:DUF5667 domain-containing protein n=1 Tax=Glycomyces arizonensis TaxID=256035 RepID=UPI00047C3065|nr:DUF5667 domain-containing protein [Glycomyces arizonensis]
MIYNPLERRRAEEFAQQLDFDDPALPHASDAARASGAATETLAELVGVTERLHELGGQMSAVTRPSTEWQDATRRRLMAVAADEGIGATARHRASAAVPEPVKEPVHDELFPRRPRGGRRIAIVAALLTGTVAVSGVSAASGDALPGETLYNVKRSTERAQLALAGTDLGRAQLHLEFASTRIEEAGALSDEDAAANALREAADELRSGAALLGELAVEHGDAGPLDYIDLFTNEHRWTLEALAAGLDDEAGAAGDDLIALVEDAAVRSVELREALECTEPGGPSDELGPIPGGCADDRRDTEDTDASSQGPTDTAVDGSESEGDDSTPEPGNEPSDEAPSADDDAAGEATETLTDAVSEPVTDAVTGDADDDEESGEVLDELSGIVEDLFG